MYTVWKHRLIGFGGIFAVFAFFGTYTFLPMSYDTRIEGKPVALTTPPRAVEGRWEGYWRSTSERLNHPLVLDLKAGPDGAVTGIGTMSKLPCDGPGDFAGTGKVADGTLVLRLEYQNRGCGVLTIAYTLFQDDDGTIWLDGRFNNVINGHRGRHVLQAKR